MDLEGEDTGPALILFIYSKRISHFLLFVLLGIFVDIFPLHIFLSFYFSIINILDLNTPFDLVT